MKLSLPAAAAVSFLSTIAGCSPSVEPVKTPANRSTIQDVDIATESERILKEQHEGPEASVSVINDEKPKIIFDNLNLKDLNQPSKEVIDKLHAPNPTRSAIKGAAAESPRMLEKQLTEKGPQMRDIGEFLGQAAIIPFRSSLPVLSPLSELVVNSLRPEAVEESDRGPIQREFNEKPLLIIEDGPPAKKPEPKLELLY